MITGNLVSPMARSELMMIMLSTFPGSIITVSRKMWEARAMTSLLSVKHEKKSLPVNRGTVAAITRVIRKPIFTERKSCL